jgi:hypothetical protein
MQLLVLRFAPPSRHSVPLRSKYSSQHSDTLHSKYDLNENGYLETVTVWESGTR